MQLVADADIIIADASYAHIRPMHAFKHLPDMCLLCAAAHRVKQLVGASRRS